MTTRAYPVAKKTSGAGGETAPSKTTVKMDSELHRKARTVASYHGKELVDFLDELLRPAIEKAYAEMARQIQREE
jgi:hypothetical protein